jgi:hypothetical protein
VGQLLSFNRKGLRLAEARHHRSSRLHLILDSVQMCCLVKIAHYATEPRQESVARQVRLWELEAPVALAADLFNRAGMGWVEEPYRLSDAHRTRTATLWVHTFLSHGWWSPIRPSSSHLTITSSSFACSTVLFSGRLSEVAPTLDAISGMQCLVGRRELGKRWLPGAA